MERSDAGTGTTPEAVEPGAHAPDDADSRATDATDLTTASSAVALSRETASQGIRQAGWLAAVGAGFYTLGLYGVVDPFDLWAQVGGLGAFGAGLCYLGVTARHMFRYGDTHLGLTFATATAFGTTLLLHAVTVPLWWGDSTILMRLPGLLWMATLGFGALLLVLVGIGLVRLIWGNVSGQAEGA